MYFEEAVEKMWKGEEMGRCKWRYASKVFIEKGELKIKHCNGFDDGVVHDWVLRDEDISASDYEIYPPAVIFQSYESTGIFPTGVAY